MRTEEFERKDGSKGESYYPEEGDKFVAVADDVFERENLAVVKGKPVKIMKYGLKVTTSDNKEIFLNLTAGQKKGLDRAKDGLSGKSIVFYNYENDYGKQIGCKVE